LWKQYYGIGLSKGLIDMGSRGEVPPNQELLDWLAIEFMDKGWDMKHMIRLIVTTNAYRQSSLPRPVIDSIDPDNRLVTHQSRFRMEAEQIRDNALAVSGLLVNKLGGDIVGMSVVPEAIAAGQMGMQVLGVSYVSNTASGISRTPLSHKDVISAGKSAAEKMGRLITGVLKELLVQKMPKK
jgi:hypothetical protein